MEAVVQSILNSSVLEIDLIRITDATPTTFTMTMEARVNRSGPVAATLAPMTVDMVGPDGCFARLDLPEIKTNPKGTNVKIYDKKIEISNMDAFLAFVKAIQCGEETTLVLDNGKSTIRALFMTNKIVYKKTVKLAGMRGPRAEILKTEVLSDGTFKNTMKTTNSSVVEMDLGVATYAFTSANGDVLAEHTGKVFIKRGESMLEMTGKVLRKGDLEGFRLVGTNVQSEAWTKQSVRFFDQTPELPKELVELIKG